MTVTYDPTHPQYYDEGDLREEMTRVYDICHGCRLCFNLCPSFHTLFDFIDKRDGAVDEMSAAEQDQVVDECYQCKLCYVKCPYVPPHEWELDFPRLMMRANAMQNKAGDEPFRDKMAKQVLARTDLVGKASTMTSAVSTLANKTTGTPNSLPRKLMEKAVGIAADRVLPPYAKQRFSTWFKKRAKPFLRKRQGSVALFPTCLVEYQNPGIGRDLTRVLEVNNVECELPEGIGCCGAPWLHSGDVDNFVKAAKRNVKKLAKAVRAGRDVVVPQPTCGYVLKRDYRLYLKGDADAELVGDNTYDAAEYLVKLHKGEETVLDRDFTHPVPEHVTYHVACHLQAQNIGLKSRDLLKLIGSKVAIVNQCSGIDGTWGYRAENYELARKVAQPLKQGIEKAGNDVVCGDCHLANGAIAQETGRQPLHPVQILARAYGIPEEGT